MRAQSLSHQVLQGGEIKWARQRVKLSITRASGKYTTIQGRQSMLVLINYSLKMSHAAAGLESSYSSRPILKKQIPATATREAKIELRSDDCVCRVDGGGGLVCVSQ